MKQSKAHFHVRKSLRNQSHPLAHIVPQNIPESIAIQFLFSIFTQTKRFQKPNIEVKGAPLASAGNAPSPCLSSIVFYIFILLLFRKTSFSLVATFCHVLGNAHATAFRPVFSPSPASRHKCSICSGPAVLLLSFQNFHEN